MNLYNDIYKKVLKKHLCFLGKGNVNGVLYVEKLTVNFYVIKYFNNYNDIRYFHILYGNIHTYMEVHIHKMLISSNHSFNEYPLTEKELKLKRIMDEYVNI